MVSRTHEYVEAIAIVLGALYVVVGLISLAVVL